MKQEFFLQPAGKALEYFFLIFAACFIIWYVIYWVYKVKTAKKRPHVGHWILGVLLLTVVVDMALPYGLYAIDRWVDRPAQVEVQLEEVVNHWGLHQSRTDGKTYRFTSDEQKAGPLQRHFVDHTCRIEYYKLSGFVIRIQRLDDVPSN